MDICRARNILARERAWRATACPDIARCREEQAHLPPGMADVINAVITEAQLPPRLACLLTVNDLVYMFVNLETPMFLERDPMKNERLTPGRCTEGPAMALLFPYQMQPVGYHHDLVPSLRADMRAVSQSVSGCFAPLRNQWIS